MNRTVKFGTDGIRGKADEYPFTSQALKAFGRAMCAWAFEKKQQQSRLKILIVSDTRISCNRIKSDVCSGLQAYDSLIIDGGIFPTPAACSIMHMDHSYDVGIVISASHNPYHDNGIKLFTSGGYKLEAYDEAEILKHFMYFEHDNAPNLIALGKTEHHDLSQLYQERIEKLYTKNFLHGLKIVIDCSNGANSFMAPKIFTLFGAEVITIFANPNGININNGCGALHPEKLQQAVVANQAYAGFAFDGDGDRIIAVNHKGEIRDGDDILWMLLSSHYYRHVTTLVGTVMSNTGLEKALAQQNKTLIRAAVGDKNVLSQLIKHNLLLGGEPSGHIILHDYLSVCDAIFVALRLLEVLITTNNKDMCTFMRFPQALINISIMEKKDLTMGLCAEIIAHYEAALQDGRILVRYSGTENMLRVMAEAPNEHQAQKIAEQLGHDLKIQLG